MSRCCPGRTSRPPAARRGRPAPATRASASSAGPAAVAHHPLDLRLHGHVDHEHGLEAVRLTGLHQQRDVVHHQGAGGRLGRDLRAPRPDQRVQDVLEPPAEPLVDEHPAPSAARSSDAVLGEHLVPERLDHRGQPGRAGLDHLAGEHVGVDDDGSPLAGAARPPCSCRSPPRRSGHVHRRSHAGSMAAPPTRLARWTCGAGTMWPCRRPTSPPVTASRCSAPAPSAYVDLVLDLLAAGVVAVPLDPRLTVAERRGLLEDLDPRLVVETPSSSSTLRERVPRRSPGDVPRCRPMHVTSGTTGRPKGVWSGLLDEPAARALVDEERDLWGFAADDVNLVLSPLHHSAPLRFAIGTLLAGGRVVVPGPFDPADGDRRDRRAATDHDVLRADPPAAALRALGRGRRPRPVVVPAGRARRGRLPAGGQGAAGRAVPGRHRPGSSTAPPRASSPPAAARSGSSGPAPSGGPGRDARCCSTTTARSGARCPTHARFTYWNAPEKTAAAWRDTEHGPRLHGRRPGPARRGRLPLPGRPPRGPGDLRRRQRLPGRGRERAARAPGRHRRRGLRGGRRAVGPAGLRGRGRRRRPRRAAGARAASGSRRPSGPRSTSRSTTLPLTATGKVRRLALPDLLGLE